MHTREELGAMIEHALQHMALPARPEGLYAPITYTLEKGGKRIRPLMLLRACDLLGGDPRAALPAATATEVFHNFTLLHDDIMDNAPTRRGKPTVHVRWSPSTAILSGDAMLIQAYRLLMQSPAATLPAVTEVFNTMALEVCEGQQYDMDFESRNDVTTDEYLRMIALKTGALIAGALRIGALIGGATEAEAATLARFGTDLGIAFQLQDDLLDTYGDPAVLGKAVGGDIACNKKTYLLASTLALAPTKTQKELALIMVDRRIDPADKFARVRAIYDALGVRELTERQVAEYFDRSLAALDSLALDAARKTPLRELALGLMNRRT